MQCKSSVQGGKALKELNMFGVTQSVMLAGRGLQSAAVAEISGLAVTGLSGLGCAGTAWLQHVHGGATHHHASCYRCLMPLSQK